MWLIWAPGYRRHPPGNHPRSWWHPWECPCKEHSLTLSQVVLFSFSSSLSLSFILFPSLSLSRPTWLPTDLSCPPFHTPCLVLVATFSPTTENTNISYTTWTKCQPGIFSLLCISCLSHSYKKSPNRHFCPTCWIGIHREGLNVFTLKLINSDCFPDRAVEQEAGAADGTTHSATRLSHTLQLSFVSIIRKTQRCLRKWAFKFPSRSNHLLVLIIALEILVYCTRKLGLTDYNTFCVIW